MACFMGLVSHLAANPSVLRIAPLHAVDLLNDVVSSIVESGNFVDTPLQDAGLDGRGEVIQVWGVLGARFSASLFQVTCPCLPSHRISMSTYTIDTSLDTERFKPREAALPFRPSLPWSPYD